MIEGNKREQYRLVRGKTPVDFGDYRRRRRVIGEAPGLPAVMGSIASTLFYRKLWPIFNEKSGLINCPVGEIVVEAQERASRRSFLSTNLSNLHELAV